MKARNIDRQELGNLIDEIEGHPGFRSINIGTYDVPVEETAEGNPYHNNLTNEEYPDDQGLHPTYRFKKNEKSRALDILYGPEVVYTVRNRPLLLEVGFNYDGIGSIHLKIYPKTRSIEFWTDELTSEDESTVTRPLKKILSKYDIKLKKVEF